MSTPARRPDWPWHIGVLVLAVVATYAHTLHVPFYLDDESSIRENALITHWQGFAALRAYAPMRVVTYSTFALNYRLGHFDPFGYHLLNIVIHLLAGLAVYGLARGLLRTPRGRETTPAAAIAGLPLIAALLFVVHPLQTQAVTYIVQRLAALVALFYVASLAAYVQARLAARGPARVAWTVACLGCVGLALFSKENAATLPAAIALIELVGFARGRKDVPRVAAGMVVAGAAIWLISALAFGSDPFSLHSMGGMASHTRSMARDRYLATQLPMLWTYFRLFAWPVGLHLDYADDVLHRFSDGPVWLALAGHLLLAGFAVWIARRRPLIAFGVLFVYVAHAVESGIIPIPELAFEHRTYLPNLGLCVVASWILWVESPRVLHDRRAVLAVVAAVVIALGIATWRRNALWRDPVAFWQDNVRLAPTKARAWGNLGRSLALANRPAEAIPALERSLELRPVASREDPGRTIDVINLVMALEALGRDDEALAWIDRSSGTPMPARLRATLMVNRGNAELAANHLGEAERAYRAALALAPTLLPAQANLASTLARGGRMAEAESLDEQVLKVDPDDVSTRVNLLQIRAARLLERGDALRGSRRLPEAEASYRQALAAIEQAARLAPDDSGVRANVLVVRARLARP